MKTNTSTNAQSRYMNTMQIAQRYGISVQTVSQWPRFKNFPDSARIRVGRDMLWDVEATDQYLRNRPLGKRGTRPGWLEIVGHKGRLTGQ